MKNVWQQAGVQDWLTFATMQRSKVVREVKELGEQIIARISESGVFVQREELIKEARHHLESLLGRLNAGSIVDSAIQAARIKARNTRTEILSFLNIPSHRELSKLQRKLNQIETRLGKLPKDAKSAPSKSASVNRQG